MVYQFLKKSENREICLIIAKILSYAPRAVVFPHFFLMTILPRQLDSAYVSLYRMDQLKLLAVTLLYSSPRFAYNQNKLKDIKIKRSVQESESRTPNIRKSRSPKVGLSIIRKSKSPNVGLPMSGNLGVRMSRVKSRVKWA